MSAYNPGGRWVGVRNVYCGNYGFADDGECHFEGLADVEIVSNVMFWDCEMCGNAHEDELEATP